MNLRYNRFVIGLVFPVIYEVLLLLSYFTFQFNQTPSLSIMLPLIFLTFPLLILYVFTPYIILTITQAERQYKRYLITNLRDIFSLSTLKLESEIEHAVIEQIKGNLIPSLVRRFRRNYVENFFYRGQSRIYLDLTWKEALLLFSLGFGTFNLLNFFVTIYLHFNSLDLDFFYIDQIVNLTNVIILATIFILMVLLSFFLLTYSKKHITTLIFLSSYTLITKDDEIKVTTRELALEAIRSFPLQDVIGTNLASNRELVAKFYEDLLKSPLQEKFEEHLNHFIAKNLAWREYSKILDKLKIKDEQRREIEQKFFIHPLVLKAFKKLTLSEEEFENLKIDLLYVKKRLDQWTTLSSDEKASSFLYLFRTAESLYRHILQTMFPSEANVSLTFYNVIEALQKRRILTYNELKELRRIRKKRNLLIHQSLTGDSITRDDMERLLEIVEDTLQRVARSFEA